MPRFHMHSIGKLGVIGDTPLHELPPEAIASFSDNLRAYEGKLAALSPSRQISGTPNHAAFALFYVPWGNKKYWVYCNNADISVWDPSTGTHHYISKNPIVGASYTGLIINNPWNACWLNGIWIANNGVDVPQYWSNGSTATRLQNLTNWPSGWQAKVVRSYKNFLLALNVTKSFTSYPTLIAWSHPADPGTPPVSWDKSDPSKLAGEVSLAQTAGPIVDAVTLREANVIYKEDSIILQQYVGGIDIFSWREITNGTGAMGQNCAVEFRPGYHFLLTADGDCVVHNGQTLESVSNGRVQKIMQNEMSYEVANRSFVVSYPEKKEVWVFLCDGINANVPTFTSAWIWNWKDNTWGVTGFTPNAINGYCAANGVIDDDPSTEQNSERLAGTVVTGGDDNLLHQWEWKLATEATQATFIYQLGISLYDQDKDGASKVDYTQHKLVTEIWPNFVGLTEPIDILIEAADTKEDLFGTTNYQLLTFDPTTDRKVDCLIEGKYIGISWLIGAIPGWEMYGYSLEWSYVGEYP